MVEHLLFRRLYVLWRKFVHNDWIFFLFFVKKTCPSAIRRKWGRAEKETMKIEIGISNILNREKFSFSFFYWPEKVNFTLQRNQIESEWTQSGEHKTNEFVACVINASRSAKHQSTIYCEIQWFMRACVRVWCVYKIIVGFSFLFFSF